MNVTGDGHRMVEVGSDLCGSSSPTLLPKQGHLQQAAQELVQAGLEYLQRRRLHNLPGQPVPVFHHPQREEILPHVQTELPVPQFVPVAPCLVAGHYWKELGPIVIHRWGTGEILEWQRHKKQQKYKSITLGDWIAILDSWSHKIKVYAKQLGKKCFSWIPIVQISALMWNLKQRTFHRCLLSSGIPYVWARSFEIIRPLQFYVNGSQVGLPTHKCK